MKKENQGGFSLIELIVVVAIIGLIATMSIPFLQKAIRATENGNMFATMRTIGSSQLGYYQRYGRFGRITEINNLFSGGLGTTSGNQVNKGKFVLEHNSTLDSPVTAPTDADLRTHYSIRATRQVTGEGVVYQYQIDQSGEIKQLLP